MQPKSRRRGIKFRVEIVFNWPEIPHAQMAVAISETSRIALLRSIELRLEAKVMKIGVKRAFTVVVINLSAIKQRMAYRQLKNTCASAATILTLRQVALTLSVNQHARDRMIYLKIPDVPFSVEDRSDADSHADVVHGQQRRIGMGFSAADNNPI